MSIKLAGEDRRRSPRVHLSARVGLVGGAPVAMGQTRDISEHGVFVEFKLSDPLQAFNRGDLLVLKFGLPDTNILVETKVTVARVEKDAKGAVSGVGFEFTNLKESD